jgi:predicted O-methyltransferase YrrM
VIGRGRAAAIRRRLRIIRAALTFGWPRVCSELRALTTPEGQEIPDILGDVNPVDFLRSLQPLVSSKHLDAIEATWRQLDTHDFGKGVNSPEVCAEPEVARFVGSLALAVGAANVIEVGSYVGFTACHIAAALRLVGSGRVYCVDVDEGILTLTRRNARALRLDDLVTTVHGDSLSEEVLGRLPMAGVVFVDSAHYFETTRDEIEAYFGKLTKPGFLVLHDSIRWPGVRRAVTESSRPKMTFATSRGAGVTVFQRP